MAPPGLCCLSPWPCQCRPWLRAASPGFISLEPGGQPRVGVPVARGTANPAPCLPSQQLPLGWEAGPLQPPPRGVWKQFQLAASASSQTQLFGSTVAAQALHGWEQAGLTLSSMSSSKGQSPDSFPGVNRAGAGSFWCHHCPLLSQSSPSRSDLPTHLCPLHTGPLVS